METGVSYKEAIVTTDNYVQNILEKTNDVFFASLLSAIDKHSFSEERLDVKLLPHRILRISKDFVIYNNLKFRIS